METGVINKATTTAVPVNTKSIIVYSDLELAIYGVSFGNKRTLGYPVITSDGIKNVERNDGNGAYYALDLSDDGCIREDAAPKALYDEDYDSYVTYIDARFYVDDSAVGSTWTAHTKSGKVAIYTYDKAGKLIKGGWMQSITLTEDVKYVTFTNGSLPYEVSEVYKTN